MTTFEYNFDKVNLEIFPIEIWQDPDIVFHGTSEYHSRNIETNGLVKGTSPFNLEDAKELLNVLKLPQVATFDRPQKFGQTVADTLNSYVLGIENGDFRLSFAYLSYLCVFFSTGRSKGGQTLGNIRDTKTIIEESIQSYPEVDNKITEPIKRLFKLEDDVANANGVVYAVKLESPYNGIKQEYGTVYSSASINKDNIVGKVILPTKIDLYEFKLVKDLNKEKLFKIGNLGPKLNTIRFSN